MDARIEMGKIVREQRIAHALKSKLPPAVTHYVKAGDEVFVFREEGKRRIGPYKVNRVEDKRVFISDGKTSRPFNITQVLPFTADKSDL